MLVAMFVVNEASPVPEVPKVPPAPMTQDAPVPVAAKLPDWAKGNLETPDEPASEFRDEDAPDQVDERAAEGEAGVALDLLLAHGRSPASSSGARPRRPATGG